VPVLLASLSVAASILAAGFLTFADTYSRESCVLIAPGSRVCTSETSSLIEENGTQVLALLVVPVLISGAGLAAILPRFDLPWFAGWLVAVGYAVLCVIAMFSIGFFFVPSALLLLAATALNGYRRAYRADGAPGRS
jgi:hypothetical protein